MVCRGFLYLYFVDYKWFAVLYQDFNLIANPKIPNPKFIQQSIFVSCANRLIPLQQHKHPLLND